MIRVSVYLLSGLLCISLGSTAIAKLPKQDQMSLQQKALNIRIQLEKYLLISHERQFKMNQLQLKIQLLQIKRQKILSQYYDHFKKVRSLQIRLLKIRLLQSKNRQRRLIARRKLKRNEHKKRKRNTKRTNRAKKAKAVKHWVGYFVTPRSPKGHRFASQHPMVVRSFGPNKQVQRYFDIVDKGKTVRQAILILTKGLKLPTQLTKLIRLTGTSKPIRMGGRRGTKRGYQGIFIRATSWNYVR